ncbi:MAG TPA: DNA-3-methyladenine glycosylase [Candidatus Bathyarchaeia archaeon]|nr:DNA-3-methyladenine glycosylase [Candidatus Bathyarchaeia archaeon]
MEKSISKRITRTIPRAFYARGTVSVARSLLGKYLVRVRGNATLVCRIVEVEAYRGRDDPASHAFHGMTSRNMPMFGQPGQSYVYFTYGNHYCLNVTTQPPGKPAAVLIRAVEPLHGIEMMRQLRSGVPDLQLTNGPGKLTKALDIDKSLNQIDLTRNGPLFIAKPSHEELIIICRSSRIGISTGKERLWRFYIRSNLYVSRGKPRSL